MSEELQDIRLDSEAEPDVSVEATLHAVKQHVHVCPRSDHAYIIIALPCS